MTLTDLGYLDKVDFNEAALLCCQDAAQLIESGQYETAREALGDLWRGTGNKPVLEGLNQPTKAEVLLVVGALSGWLASAHVRGSQEQAKDILTKARREFQSLNNNAKVAEVNCELGVCYWRTGAFDEARVVLRQALKELHEAELKAKTLIRLTLVEISQCRYHEAWDILRQAQPVFEDCSAVTKGKWHAQLALVLRRLATAENRTDYADSAIMEFTAAIYQYEEAGHQRYCATNLNNLAMLLYKLKRYGDAHQNLDRAREFLLKVNDAGLLAQVDETRSQVLLAEHRYPEAETTINRAVATFESGDEQALLVDALTIRATIQARLGNENSLGTFRRAIELAETAGAQASAGLAALSLLEEHSQALSEAELCHTYKRADNLLSQTQDAEHIARLRSCAGLVLMRVTLTTGRSLSDSILAYESRHIEQALLDANGSITRAARKLGMTHQALSLALLGRHKDLLTKRSPIVKRKKSIFNSARKRRTGAN
ncbi:MAG TPA: helix-turn-helix domain-containing protein [Pyrinomonadaceae bacterium]|jgi:tetratricopeptide (TPR) repeat protein|nr:helix-turn-helix domain-containing protein [Pyrinomonadaceae bacterium]